MTNDNEPIDAQHKSLGMDLRPGVKEWIFTRKETLGPELSVGGKLSMCECEFDGTVRREFKAVIIQLSRGPDNEQIVTAREEPSV